MFMVPSPGIDGFFGHGSTRCDASAGRAPAWTRALPGKAYTKNPAPANKPIRLSPKRTRPRAIPQPCCEGLANSDARGVPPTDAPQRVVPSLADDGFERLAALVLHHHVAGVVQLEEIEHRYDERIAESGENLALFQKSLASPHEGFGFILRRRADTAVVIPDRKLLRKVLFDGDGATQIGIGCEIGYPESPGTENAFYFV